VKIQENERLDHQKGPRPAGKGGGIAVSPGGDRLTPHKWR